MNCKKLIEVAMPVKEISAESVRDKSIRHGHISTLHLWWARRPLPVCRAVVFASLVPDPLDDNCPEVFKEAVQILLGKETNQGDPYKPYEDIPYTSAIDKMEDNERNRLLMFIGKFSDAYIKNEKTGKVTPAKELLSGASLIKWESKNNESIINKARKLIWVSHNSEKSEDVNKLFKDFDEHLKKIKDAESDLYNFPDRHKETKEVKQKEQTLQKAIDEFLDRMPKVFDPFAGGGAIPLEAARLGCKTYANDLNPVAHIIEKGSIEFPQKYGKPIVMTAKEFLKKYDFNERKDLAVHEPESLYSTKQNILEIEDFEDAKSKINSIKNYSHVKINNRLAFDVEYYAKKMLKLAENEIGHLYPADENGKKPIAYYWARVATCSNPSCKAEVPLLKQFYLCNKKDKKICLNPLINGNEIDFEIKKGECELEGWVSRGNLNCPVCKNTTDVKKVKQQFIDQLTSEKILAVIFEGENGKEYRKPNGNELEVLNQIPKNLDRPKEKMQRNSAGGDTFSWGINEWGQMFSDRQLLAMQTLVSKLNEIKSELNAVEIEYDKAVVTYLGILIDRVAASNNMFTRWRLHEAIDSPFSKQAIAMTSDYPETNIFCNSSGSIKNQMDWIIRFIFEESSNIFYSYCNNSSSGDNKQFGNKYIEATITDPPYFDAIAYADISDFFYLWLKRSIGDCFLINFSMPQTPKSEECTALKHHHDFDLDKARKHFQNKLLLIFKSVEYQTSDIIVIMFAHQTTDAWTTLCNSIINASMNITGSWSIDTEMETRSIALAGAALESSVTVSCRPSQKSGTADFTDVRKAIQERVEKEVEVLYGLGFRGADLLTACFGQAVSEFGKYEKVEKGDGTEVTVAELLKLAREAAFNALVKGFPADDFTKFYIGWQQLYGFTETDFDDAAQFTRVGLTINVKDLFDKNILIKNGNKQTLGNYEERNKLDKNLGEDSGDYLIDKVHKAMMLYITSDRNKLLKYIAKTASSPENIFWRVLTSLSEILPPGSQDSKAANGLLGNKETDIKQSMKISGPEVTQEEIW